MPPKTAVDSAPAPAPADPGPRDLASPDNHMEDGDDDFGPLPPFIDEVNWTPTFLKDQYVPCVYIQPVASSLSSDSYTGIVLWPQT